MPAPSLQSMTAGVPWLFRQAPKMLTFRRVACRIPLHFKAGDYTVKTVQYQHELAAVQRLRYRVFHREFAGKRFPLGHDKEQYDQFADLLMVRDDRTDQVVGTYRMILSSHSERFYSESEFDIAPILKLEGTKLELSRACIHRRYRQGRIMNLLWRGVAQYIQLSRTDYVFGMGSILSTSPAEIGEVMRALSQGGHMSPDLHIEALDGLKVRYSVEHRDDGVSCEIGNDNLPSLMKSYLRAGAKVCSEPALDEKFRCVDLLTMWDVRSSSSAVRRRYLPDQLAQ